ncbi:Imm52 family immunity protein [Actinokineospora fastidiosa]|uniref:Immunity protein 52 domain-containing protein n=1 Tax=Actinokineospora fastidiosa TaxID=1816 RepID=A0A918GS65_9PSEU|nr:Imm52 family immunity protein [Actinokineospora fastidiosa]GGS54666.1 hypothetical protein GCM10010171_57270 [Actinokineospora fastidiosa]
MTDPMFLGAYWGDRSEDRKACARRLADYLSRARVLHPLLKDWSRKGRSKSPRFVDVDPDSLSAVLRGGSSHSIPDGSDIERLGFTAGLWNGSPVTPISVNVTCGLHASTAGLMNSVAVNLPDVDDPAAAKLYTFDVAIELLEMTIECWTPDWAVLTPFSFRGAQKVNMRESYVGWLTYLSAPRRVLIENMNDRGWVREVDDGGVILVAGENASQASLISLGELRTDLVDRGALYPTPLQ